MEVTFSELSLAVAPGRVMTPRSVSEQLVATALRALGSRPARVVDVGTGSGALAIALAAAAPQKPAWIKAMRRRSPLFGARSYRGGRVRVYGCAPGCLLVSLAVSLLLTITVNLLIRLF